MYVCARPYVCVCVGGGDWCSRRGEGKEVEWKSTRSGGRDMGKAQKLMANDFQLLTSVVSC